LTDTKPDKATSVEIGFDNTDKTIIASNLFAFGDKFVPFIGSDQVDPIITVNDDEPDGVRQNGGNYEMSMVLDGDCRYAFYSQKVETTGGFAIVDDGDNNWIAWFKVNYRRAAGTTYTITYQASKVMCIGGQGNATPSQIHAYTNREGQRSLTTYRFICIGTKT